MTERVYFSINKLMNYINENKLFDKYVDPVNNHYGLNRMKRL